MPQTVMILGSPCTQIICNHLIPPISVCGGEFVVVVVLKSSSMPYIQLYLFSLDNQNFRIIKVSSNHWHKDRYKDATELR